MWLIRRKNKLTEIARKNRQEIINAKLSRRDMIAAGPTVFRDDYLQALRALTRRHRPGPFVQAMIRAQRFSCLEFSPYPSVLRELTRRHWFREPDEARIVEGPLSGEGALRSSYSPT